MRVSSVGTERYAFEPRDSEIVVLRNVVRLPSRMSLTRSNRKKIATEQNFKDLILVFGFCTTTSRLASTVAQLASASGC